jgi:dual specificity protein kinase YAK1
MTVAAPHPDLFSSQEEDVSKERLRRSCFTDFLLGVLELDPALRWTPRQAVQHPFMTGERTGWVWTDR